MSGFSSHWLELREPADHAARSAELTDSLCRWLAGRARRVVVDLGCGTGSNFRYLAPRLGRSQHWELIDHDRSLLAALPARLADWAPGSGHRMQETNDDMTFVGNGFSASITARQLDLASEFDTIDLDAADVVTGSALLDLTSTAWMQRLASRCRDQACAMLFVLSYDGRIHWQPPQAHDRRLRDALNRHQQQDKGLGMAMGPQAGSHMAALLAQHGLQVLTQRSDWQLDAGHLALQRELVRGWAAAVIEHDTVEAGQVDEWLAARLAAIDAGESRLGVGHIDVLALPPDRR